MTVSYFAERPDVVKVFNDLEKFKNFCRFNAYKWDEANLYKNESIEWQSFLNNKSNWPVKGSNYKGKKPFNKNHWKNKSFNKNKRTN